jgi:hypothetical protein
LAGNEEDKDRQGPYDSVVVYESNGTYYAKFFRVEAVRMGRTDWPIVEASRLEHHRDITKAAGEPTKLIETAMEKYRALVAAKKSGMPSPTIN